MVGRLRTVLACLGLCVGLTVTPAVCAQTANASITLSLEDTEVYSGDTVVLQIESTGLLDPIDLSPVKKQASLIRETTGTRIAVIGGKVSEIAIRRMDLLPEKPGLMVIGPLIAGDVQSNSVHINILEGTRPQWQVADDDLKITVSTTPGTPYVNQQVTLTIELLHRYPINNETVNLPELKGFAKRPVLEARRTFRGDDKEWYSTQWQYLLFPENSGAQQIDPIDWSGTASKSRIEKSPFTRRHKAVVLNVRAKHTADTNWWLPASGLSLQESWSEPVTSLRAGDELLRTITIEAKGVLSGQLPEPSVPESRALSQTLIDSRRSETITGSSITSTAEFIYRVKAQSPIPVFLDTVRMQWWDTTRNSATQSIIPARRINVGLPDRADLLSSIALTETGATGLKHWLQSTSTARLSLYIAGTFSTLLLLYVTLPELIRQLAGTNKKRQRYARLRQFARQGDIQSICTQLASITGNNPTARVAREFSERLQSALYAPDTTELTAGQLGTLVEKFIASDQRIADGDVPPCPDQLAKL